MNDTITEPNTESGHVKRKAAAFEAAAASSSAPVVDGKVSQLTAKFESLATQSIFKKPVTTSDAKETEESALTRLINTNARR